MTRYHIILSLLLCALLAGCSAEGPDAPDVPEGPARGLTLSVSAGSMLPQVVTSRAAGDPEQKTAAEKQIRTLHIFFFGADGQFLAPTRPDEFAPYMAYDFTDGSQPRVIIPADAFEGQATMTDATIVAVANIYGSRFRTEWTPDGDITSGAAGDALAQVTVASLADLEAWVYRPKLRTDVSALPDPGMPMSGMLAGVDLTGSDALQMSLRALMARVDVNVSLNAAQHSADRSLPTLTVRRFGVMNMPCIVPLFAREGVTEADAEGEIVEDMTTDVDDPLTLTDGNGTAHFSYYTYENIRRPDDSGFGGYPAGVAETDEARQRWKPRRAHAHASALVMHADYRTRQGLDVKGRFTFYLGANTVDNFEVHRNRVYTNNITVRGLDYVRNSDESVHTFDARVNVTTDNPFFISMIGERRIDAHWGVLPVDFYFLAGAPEGAQIGVEILEPERYPWMRLELCDAAGRAESELVPGWGCRPYFTTDLVTSTLAANTACTVGSNRSRVYFYIDENASTRSRQVSVRFTYRATPEAEPIVTTAEFEQAGLLPFTSGGTTYYMEAYEEYAEHRDPLDPHTPTPWYQPDGLPWARPEAGFFDRQICVYSYKFPVHDIRPFDSTDANGLRISNYVFGLGSDGKADLSIPGVNALGWYPNAEYYSAIHYAAAKNTRNSSGDVTSLKWFLPGISELEAIMHANPNTNTFKESFYWSANPARDYQYNGLVVLAGKHKEWTERARATKIDANGNHVESGADDSDSQLYPNGGRVLRTQKLRVRAIRVADGVNAD